MVGVFLKSKIVFPCVTFSVLPKPIPALLSFFKLKFRREKEFKNTELYNSKTVTSFHLNSRGSFCFLSLHRIVARASKNLMSTQSLGIVFGPTLLRAENESGNMAVHMVYQNQIAELMLGAYDRIFS